MSKAGATGDDGPRAILIAEDERIVARDMARILGGAGYEVLGIASSPEMVRAALRERSPDLLLLDIALVRPNDGLELASTLDVPIVFVSGRSDLGTLRRAGALTVRGFVVKPFTPAQLLASVEIALGAGSSVASPQELAQARAALASIAQTLEDVGFALPTEPSDGPRFRAVPGLESLSPREREVLDALLAHRRPPQIAQDLFISAHTVRNHLKSIYAKLGVHSQGELLELVVVRDGARDRSAPTDE
jgi:DNA-binding NarL/FixJ family response regulator